MKVFRFLTHGLALGLTVALIFITDSTATASDRSSVVGVPGVSAAELKAYATSIDQLPLSEQMELSRPGLERSRELKQKFERAQRLWLSGETEASRSEFRSITELTLKADWRDPQREVLQFSYLRLAQSAESGTEKNSWLEASVRYFSDLKPNSALFPPPLLEEFEAARHRSFEASIEIDFSEVFPESRFVLIDGRKITTAERNPVKVALGTHRVSALSDTHVAITEFLTSAQLRLFRAAPASLVDGVCGSAKIKSDLALDSKFEIYSGTGCVNNVRPLDLQPTLLAGRPRSSALESSLVADNPTNAKSKDKTMWWIIGGALLAGAGYALSQELNKDKAPEAVHRSGF